MWRLLPLSILTVGFAVTIGLVSQFGLAGVAPALAVLAIVCNLALTIIRLRQSQPTETRDQQADVHRLLSEQLDETGRLDLERLVELEQTFDRLISKGTRPQFISAEIPMTFSHLMKEAVSAIERRNQYRQFLTQTDVLKLRSDLEITHLELEREVDLLCRPQLEVKVEQLNQELMDLKQLNTTLEQLDQDIASAQSALHCTVVLLTEPITDNYDSRLSEQADKLRRVVEISQEVNIELAEYNTD